MAESDTDPNADPSASLPLRAEASPALAGRLRVPGDKSISHRALLLGGLAAGVTEIEGLLEGEDVLCTAAAMRAMGAGVERLGPGQWRVEGRGSQGLEEPGDVLDFGNSGTGARLAMGVVAGLPIAATFTGDASLRRRPMGRVLAPLREMGAQALARGGDRLPLTLRGADPANPVTYRLPVPSAQVKSAVLLAGLGAPGTTRVLEPEPTRDHTERMLAHLGAAPEIGEEGGVRVVAVEGGRPLKAAPVRVPGDPSSAAFPLVAALLVPGSKLEITDVLVNPLRTGLFQTLREMGAKLAFANERVEAGEPVADLVVEGGGLRGVEVPPERAPSMIDEYPVLAVAAAFAEGRTVMRGLGELRVKESDRLASTAAGLKACGVPVEELEDGLIVEGRPGAVPGGGTVATEMDHRIAMAFLVLGLAAQKPVRVDDGRVIDTSFPDFAGLMQGLGARIGAP